MRVDRSLNKENLIVSDKLWLEDDGVSFKYDVGKRVGIDYAAEIDRNKLWRFYKINESDTMTKIDLSRLHTTEMSVDRIKRNLNSDIDDVVNPERKRK